MARPGRVESGVVVRLTATGTCEAVMTASGVHLLRGRDVLGYLTEREMDKLAEEWLRFRGSDPPKA